MTDAGFPATAEDLERRERETASALMLARQSASAAAAVLADLEGKLAPAAILEADIAEISRTVEEASRQYADVERRQYANLTDQAHTRRDLAGAWEDMESLTRQRRDHDHRIADDAAEARRLVAALTEIRDRRNGLAARREALDRDLNDATAQWEIDTGRLTAVDARRQRHRETLDRRLSELGIPGDPEASESRLREERQRLSTLENLARLSRKMARLAVAGDPESRLADLEAGERRTADILSDARSLLADLEVRYNANPDPQHEKGLAATVASQVRRVAELTTIRERIGKDMTAARHRVTKMARLASHWRGVAASWTPAIAPGDVATVEALLPGVCEALESEEERLAEIRFLERALVGSDHEDGKARCETSRSRLDALLKEAESLDWEITGLNQEESGLREKLDAIFLRHDTARTRPGREAPVLADLERRREVVTTREERLSQLRDHHARLSERMTALQTDLRDLQQELDLLTTRLRELQDHRSVLKAHHSQNGDGESATNRLAEARHHQEMARNRKNRLEAEAAQLAADRLVFDARSEDARK